MKDNRKNPAEGLLQITYSKLTNLKLLCVGHWWFVSSQWHICKQPVELSAKCYQLNIWECCMVVQWKCWQLTDVCHPKYFGTRVQSTFLKVRRRWQHIFVSNELSTVRNLWQSRGIKQGFLCHNLCQREMLIELYLCKQNITF